jgi:hypothetical protein
MDLSEVEYEYLQWTAGQFVVFAPFWHGFTMNNEGHITTYCNLSVSWLWMPNVLTDAILQRIPHYLQLSYVLICMQLSYVLICMQLSYVLICMQLSYVLICIQ